MAEYVEVLKIGDLKDGEMKRVNAAGREILLARVGDRFFATDNICPHMKAKLANGKLEGTVVTCPRHGSQFDLSNGRVVRWSNWSGIRLAVAELLKSPKPIATYPVKIEGDKVLVEI